MSTWILWIAIIISCGRRWNNADIWLGCHRSKINGFWYPGSNATEMKEMAKASWGDVHFWKSLLFWVSILLNPYDYKTCILIIIAPWYTYLRTLCSILPLYACIIFCYILTIEILDSIHFMIANILVDYLLAYQAHKVVANYFQIRRKFRQ